MPATPEYERNRLASVLSPNLLYLPPQEPQEHQNLNLTRRNRPHRMTMTPHLSKLPRKATHLRLIRRCSILKTWQAPLAKLITRLQYVTKTAMQNKRSEAQPEDEQQVSDT